MEGQKSVCIDPEVAPESGDCLVYSFDPSIGFKRHDHSPHIHFYDWGLGDKDEYDENNNMTVRSLDSIYDTLSAKHGHKMIDYLKMDIEDSEWIVLPQIFETGMLSKVRQLGVEIHTNVYGTLELHWKLAKILRSMEKIGMVRFDFEYNPWTVGDFYRFHLYLRGPSSHEIVWYNNKLLNKVTQWEKIFMLQ